MLKITFGATRVMVFGSLVHNDQFSLTSDINLAVWGINGENCFVAVARLEDVSPEFEIDLVAMEACQKGEACCERRLPGSIWPHSA